MEKSFPGIISGLKLVDNFNVMKRFKAFLVYLSVGIIFYLYWQHRLDSEKQIPPLKNSKKIETISDRKSEIPPTPPKPTQIIPSEKPVKSKKIMGFSVTEKNNYFQKIRDTIKDQWKELEECENEFDLNFGELMKMGPNQAKDYLSDPNNLDNFLEKFSSFNMTTPSSAKMIKLLAEPIASEVDKKEIIETVGFVKTCRDLEKSNLLWVLHNLKNKNQLTAQATIGFFENENSTLTYPDILYKQIWDIKIFLDDYGIDRTAFPEITQIEKDQAAHLKKLDKIYETMTPEERATFKLRIQKEDYEYAIQLQPKIQLLLKKIKERFI
jgi:hypothetical protein